MIYLITLSTRSNNDDDFLGTTQHHANMIER